MDKKQMPCSKFELGEMPKSPLTGRANVEYVRCFIVDEIIRQWQSQLGIDISGELQGVDSIDVFKCRDTGLIFFRPSESAGSGFLYELLSKFDWYYTGERWEYLHAMQSISPLDHVLEVGCGDGLFLQKLKDHGVVAEGIDFNQAAVADAQRRGLNAHCETVESLSKSDKQESYDVVCLFQLLEHLPEPGGFLNDAIQLLKPGGRLLIAVPNHASFIRMDPFSILQIPPHHMSHWTPEVMEAIPRYFPLSLSEIAFENLDLSHVDWLSSILTRRVHCYKVVHPFLRRVLRFKSIRQKIRGHTMYAEMRKNDS